jgi:hypothetical protein
MRVDSGGCLHVAGAFGRCEAAAHTEGGAPPPQAPAALQAWGGRGAVPFWRLAWRRAQGVRSGRGGGAGLLRGGRRLQVRGKKAPWGLAASEAGASVRWLGAARPGQGDAGGPSCGLGGGCLRAGDAGRSLAAPRGSKRAAASAVRRRGAARGREGNKGSAWVSRRPPGGGPGGLEIRKGALGAPIREPLGDKVGRRAGAGGRRRWGAKGGWERRERRGARARCRGCGRAAAAAVAAAVAAGAVAAAGVSDAGAHISTGKGLRGLTTCHSQGPGATAGSRTPPPRGRWRRCPAPRGLAAAAATQARARRCRAARGRAR